VPKKSQSRLVGMWGRSRRRCANWDWSRARRHGAEVSLLDRPCRRAVARPSSGGRAKTPVTWSCVMPRSPSIVPEDSDRERWRTSSTSRCRKDARRCEAAGHARGDGGDAITRKWRRSSPPPSQITCWLRLRSRRRRCIVGGHIIIGDIRGVPLAADIAGEQTLNIGKASEIAQRIVPSAGSAISFVTSAHDGTRSEIQ
jgi:hypothetical protein